MRKLLVYLLILPLFSCDDFLTVESENDVTFVNYFKTESDVELVVIDMMAAELQLWGLMTYSNLSFLDLAALPCDEYENENVRNLNVGVFTDPENGILGWVLRPDREGGRVVGKCFSIYRDHG